MATGQQAVVLPNCCSWTAPYINILIGKFWTYWLDPGISSGEELWRKNSKRGETEASSDWFTWDTNKVRDTELALTTEAAGTLPNS